MNSDTEKEQSGRSTVLRHTSIIGSASVISVLVGLVRMKLAAIIVGPAGVGLIGLLQSLIASASTLAGLGATNAGTRHIAQALRDPRQLANARAALFWGTWCLAAGGGLLVWLLREPVAVLFLGDSSHAGAMGWIALGVALSVGAGSQTALLRGMQQPKALALVMILGALVGTSLACLSLLLFREHGIFLFVIAAPLANFLAGHWFARQLPHPGRPESRKKIFEEWGILTKLGFILMLTSLAVTVGHLLLRTVIGQKLGPEPLGYFQAAWMISATYISFVFGAMGNEFFPRVAAHIYDREKIVQLVNQQTELGLLIGGPIILAMYLLAPLAILILFSKDFLPAGELVRLMILGDLIKLIGFPHRYVVMSSERPGFFLISEILPICFLVAIVSLLCTSYGINVAGWGYIGMQLLILLLCYGYTRKKYFFRSDLSLKHTLAVIFSFVFIASFISELMQSMGVYAMIALTILTSLIYSAWKITKFRRKQQ